MPDTCNPILRVPGPRGLSGTNGTNGTNGENAYTTVTTQFVMPAEGANVAVTVGNSDWMVPGQNVEVQAAGTMQVISKGSSTTVTLKNLEDTALSLYLNNAAPGTIIPALSSIGPGGIQGAAGSAAGAGAPTTGSYWTRTSEAGLSSESALDLLADGIVLNSSGAPATIDPLDIARGGTGEQVAADAFDALAPTTTDGDIVFRGAATNQRLAKDTNATRYLSNTGTNNRPAWAQVNLANGVTGVLPVANGGSATAVATAFHANRNGTTQSGFSPSVPKLVEWTTALISNAMMSLVTSRYTPTVAGNFLLNASILWQEGTLAGGEALSVSIYKNGVEVARSSIISVNTLVNSQTIAVSTTQAANGTTDYFEVYATQGHASNGQVLDGAVIATFFCGNKVN